METIGESAVAEALRRSRVRRLAFEPALGRAIRERAGLTQDDLGSALGLCRETISRYETGSRAPRGADLENYLRLLLELARGIASDEDDRETAERLGGILAELGAAVPA